MKYFTFKHNLDVDGRPVPYVTRFGEKSDQGGMLAILDADDSEAHLYDYSTHMEGEVSAALTLRRTHDGKLQIVNQGVHEVQVGIAPFEQTPEKKSFSLRSVYQGVKNALRGTHNANQDDRRWSSRLSARMGWKPESYQVAHWTRWQRQQKQLATTNA